MKMSKYYSRALVVLNNESLKALVLPEFRIFALKELTHKMTLNTGLQFPPELLRRIVIIMYKSHFYVVKLISRSEFLSEFISERDTPPEVLESLLNILDSYGLLSVVLQQGVRYLLQQQEATVQPNLIFRQQGYINKLIRALLGILRSETSYLQETISPVLGSLLDCMANQEEVRTWDQIKSSNDSDDKYFNNTWIFENFLTILLQTLFSSANDIPPVLKELIWIIKTEVDIEFPQHTVRAIATIIPLFIIPYIVQKPEFQGESRDPRINIILQHLSNRTKFRDGASKSVYLNTFIERYQGPFDNYLKSLSTLSSKRNDKTSRLCTIREALTKDFIVLFKDLSFDKLSQIITKIQEKPASNFAK